MRRSSWQCFYNHLKANWGELSSTLAVADLVSVSTASERTRRTGSQQVRLTEGFSFITVLFKTIHNPWTFTQCNTLLSQILWILWDKHKLIYDCNKKEHAHHPITTMKQGGVWMLFLSSNIDTSQIWWEDREDQHRVIVKKKMLKSAEGLK